MITKWNSVRTIVIYHEFYAENFFCVADWNISDQNSYAMSPRPRQTSNLFRPVAKFVLICKFAENSYARYLNIYWFIELIKRFCRQSSKVNKDEKKRKLWVTFRGFELWVSCPFSVGNRDILKVDKHKQNPGLTRFLLAITTVLLRMMRSYWSSMRSLSFRWGKSPSLRPKRLYSWYFFT